MKYKYKFHPNQYELGDNEQFYSNMEEKGWRLVKRGALLSKFKPVEPSRARYRIEVYQPSAWATADMPEEHLAVFEDCGWERAAVSLPLQIFRAPAGSDAPEFYADPAQQAETLKKLKRTAAWGWVPAFLYWVMWLVIGLSLHGSANLSGRLLRRFVEIPPGFLIAGFALAEGLYDGVRNAWLITRTYRRLKKGVPLDHNPKKNRWLHRTVSGILWGLTICSGLLLAVQLIGTRTYDMPLKADGPYYLIHDIGYEGERYEFMGHDSKVTYSRTLLADYWDTEEYISTGKNTAYHLNQNIYRLRDADMAFWLADALVKSAILGHDGRDFVPVDTDVMDAAWTTHEFEVVAVKGPYVAYIIQTGWGGKLDASDICQALAERWK